MDWNGVSVDLDDAAPFGVVNLGGLIGLGKQHAMERQRETLAAGLDQEAAQYGCRDGDDDPELGAGAGFGSHLNPAMNGLDIGPDDVETYTSSGDVGDEWVVERPGSNVNPRSSCSVIPSVSMPRRSA